MPTSPYPGALDDASTLYTPADSFSGKPLTSTLAVLCLNTDTTLQLAAAVVSAIGGPAAWGIVSIGDEQIVYAAASGNNLTGCIRGAFGTTAAGHAAGVSVRWRYVAAYDEALQAGLEATQATLGTTGAFHFVEASAVTTTVGDPGDDDHVPTEAAVRAAVDAAAGVPGGSDKQVQFNDGGSAFGGDAGLTYDKTTDWLTLQHFLKIVGIAGINLYLAEAGGPTSGNWQLRTNIGNLAGATRDNTGVPGWAFVLGAGSDYFGIYRDNGSGFVELFRVTNAGAVRLAGAGPIVTEFVTSVGTPGVDTKIATEKAVRDAIPATLAPSGAAGGDLGGTYPNPTVTGIAAKVVGPSSATNNHVPQFDGTTGKLIKDGLGVVTLVHTDPTSASDGDLATEKAVSQKFRDLLFGTAGYVPKFGSGGTSVEDGFAVDTTLSGSGDNLSFATTAAIIAYVLAATGGLASTGYADAAAAAAQAAAQSYADSAIASALSGYATLGDLSGKADHGTYVDSNGDSVSI